MLQSDTDRPSLWERYAYSTIAVLAVGAIVLHFVLRWVSPPHAMWPLYVALALGGTPIVVELAGNLLRGEFGSDLLAGVSITTAVILEEYLAGVLVVLMISGGEAIERFALRSASSVLEALARRMPVVAHRREGNELRDVPVESLAVGDEFVVLPHDICPVDGEVIEGHGWMDEAFLTGEPYQMSKAPGSDVISGALNGETALTIRASRRAVDSRYAQIMQVMQQSEQQRPRMRRLGDTLGAYYTPLALAIAIGAALFSGDATRFLAVIVTATPCPLLIAIPVAIIGAISLSARRGIIIRKPEVLEQVDTVSTIMFDKTGTLTYGAPQVTEQLVAEGFEPRDVLSLAASVEQYSKHPLAKAILDRASQEGVPLQEVRQISEKPGQGLTGTVAQRQVRITSRNKLAVANPDLIAELPPQAGGLECVVLVDGRYAGTYRFRDAARKDGRPFVDHLRSKHGMGRVMILSGDRESEVRYLAEQVGIADVHAQMSPEEKLELVKEETAKVRTLFVGDGINDAPALATATVGLAFGTGSDITSAAAGAVVLEPSLRKVDEFLHIGQRMRRIALQSAVGGMAASLVAMGVAAAGYLPPVGGAIVQEIIDVVAVLNAVRVAIPTVKLTDY